MLSECSLMLSFVQRRCGGRSDIAASVLVGLVGMGSELCRQVCICLWRLCPVLPDTGPCCVPCTEGIPGPLASREGAVRF